MPFQTRTRAQSAAEVAAAAAAVNTTNTDTITDTENLRQHQTGTLNPTISDPILVDLSSPGNSHSTTGVHSVTDAHVMMTDDSSTVADFWNFKIKPDEYNPIHSNTRTTLTTNVVYTSNKNPR